MSRSDLPSTYCAWLRVASPSGLKFGSPPNWVIRTQLGDPLGRNVGMTLFLVRVLEELLGHCLCMNASGHVVVTSISQYTDNLRRQDLIQNADYRFPVRTVAASDRTHLHVLASTPAEFLNVCHEWTMLFFSGFRLHCSSSLLRM